MNRRLPAFAALLAAGAMGTLSCSAPDLESLVLEALALSPEVAGRLASIPHRPPAEHPSAEQERRLAELQLTIAQAFRDPAPAGLRAAAALAAGDTLTAVRLLERAVAADPAPDLRNDLAVALLARADATGAVLGRVRALAIIRTARTNTRPHAALEFNEALLLTRLHLVEQATESLEALRNDPHQGPWKPAIEQLRHGIDVRIEKARGAERVAAEHERLLPDRPTTTAFTREHPHLARQLAIDGLLPEWGRALLHHQQPEADRLLRRAGWIGDALFEQRGEGLALDAVEAARAAQPDSLRSVANAYAEFGEGRRLFEIDDTDAAAARFATARELLAASGSPITLWCRYYEGVAAYYHDVADAEHRLTELAGEVPDAYPSLAGRVHWMRGSIAHVVQDAGAGLELYRRAHRLRTAGGGTRAAAFTHMLMAVGYHDLGDTDRAFEHTGKALEELMYTTDPRRRDVALLVTAENLVRMGLPDYAAPFSEESIRIARDRDGVTLSSAYKTRAAVHRARGDFTAALAAARDSVAALGRSPAGGMRDFAEGLARFEEVLALMRLDPRTGADEATRVLRAHDRAGYEYVRADLLVARADARSSLGDAAGADVDLTLAIEELEQLRASVGDLELRARAAGRGRVPLARLLKIAIESGDRDELRLLGLADRARARVLSDLMETGITAAQRPNDLTRIVETLPTDRAIAVYTTLPEGLLIQLIRAGAVESTLLPIAPERIVDRSTTLTRWLSGDALSGGAEAARDLYEWLMAPLQLGPEVQRLVVVPDGALQGVAFGLLRAPDDRPAIAEREIVAVPTLALLARRNSDPEPTTTPTSVLAVGIGSAGSSAGLARLPNAVPEARSVRSLYPDGTLLTDETGSLRTLLESMPYFPVVHLAGHAVTDPGAALGASLVLPASGDDDDRLGIGEMARLDLSRVELVVLSACETAVSFEARSEGIGGLASGFLVRGVTTVIGAVARTNDLESVEFMRQLHAHVAAGEDPVAALRTTMLAQLEDWRSWEEPPGTWSLFTVYGGR